MQISEYVEEKIVIGLQKEEESLIEKEIEDEMDERGYISIDIVGIEKNMGIEKEEIGRIMGVMKGFDKKGIFERDMSE